MSKSVGYARVSSKEQNLDRQIDALRKYVPDEMIVSEKASGKDLNRPGYTSLKVGIGKLVKGDTLYIKSLDRLSRNKDDIKNELQYYASIGVRVKVLDLPTTMTDLGEEQSWIIDMVNSVLVEVLASIAENERLTILQRQAEGMAAMKIGADGKRISNRTGRATGRPVATYPLNWDEVIEEWSAGGITARKAMERMELKPTTFYKLVKLSGIKKAS